MPKPSPARHGDVTKIFASIESVLDALPAGTPVVLVYTKQGIKYHVLCSVLGEAVEQDAAKGATVFATGVMIANTHEREWRKQEKAKRGTTS